MKLISKVSAVFLAVVFLYAGIDKAFHYTGFVNALLSYVLVPTVLAEPLAPAVILAEIWVGLGLLIRPWRARAALAGAILLTLFTIAFVVNQIYAPGSVCGCWFTLTLARGTGMHIAQNLVFAGLALTVWRDGRGRDSMASSELQPSADETPSR